MILGLFFAAALLAQTQAPAAPPPPAPGTGGVGTQGDLDPGVHYVVLVDNPQVRALLVILQPGASRRTHIHNDVTFNVLVPVVGAMELNVDGTVVAAIPGQAYFTSKGQAHSFANRSGAAVQVIDILAKPPDATPPTSSLP